jgi:hypothetical protein
VNAGERGVRQRHRLVVGERTERGLLGRTHDLDGGRAAEPGYMGQRQGQRRLCERVLRIEAQCLAELALRFSQVPELANLEVVAPKRIVPECLRICCLLLADAGPLVAGTAPSPCGGSAANTAFELDSTRCTSAMNRIRAWEGSR